MILHEQTAVAGLWLVSEGSSGSDVLLRGPFLGSYGGPVCLEIR